MDDYSIGSLQDSRNEWCARLINILYPLINEGLKSIFDDAYKLCEENDEEEKYLMTFQNFLTRIPKWSNNIIENETKRIEEKSNCTYLQDLISCVHIIQLKSLTCMRVGQKQKKVDLEIPSLNNFIHKIYINVARKIYTNVYLFEKHITPLQVQKHNRELEVIIKECTLNTIRDNIPVESILKVYMDETVEEDLEVEEKEEIISTDPIEEDVKEVITANNVTDNVNDNVNEKTSIKEGAIEKSIIEKLKFSDIDDAIDTNNNTEQITAPKTIERLEQISNERNEQRKLDELEDLEEDNDGKITIGENVSLDDFDVHNINKKETPLNDNISLTNQIEILT
jgi:hypothetical protein